MPFPLDEKYIIETEKELDILFLGSFKVKMMQENGGELVIADNDWQLYPFFDKSDKKRINRTCNPMIWPLIMVYQRNKLTGHND